MDIFRLNCQEKRPSLSIRQSTSFYSLIQLLKLKNNCQKIITQAAKRFQVKQYNILNITPNKAEQMYLGIKARHYDLLEKSVFVDQWYDNELRLFIWLFVAYSYLYKRHSQQFSRNDWNFFSGIFVGKSNFFLQYQAKIIKKSCKKGKKWTPEEDSLMLQILKWNSNILEPIAFNRWGEIAKKMFQYSSRKFFRTPKQCRERWINHLDPEKLKSKWSLQEDYFLISFVKKQGKKWSLASKMMEGKRTEHSVKNRFNSLVNSWIKNQNEIRRSQNQQNLLLHLKNQLEKQIQQEKAKKKEIEQMGEQKKEGQKNSGQNSDSIMGVNFAYQLNMLGIEQDMLRVRQFKDSLDLIEVDEDYYKRSSPNLLMGLDQLSINLHHLF